MTMTMAMAMTDDDDDDEDDDDGSMAMAKTMKTATTTADVGPRSAPSAHLHFSNAFCAAACAGLGGSARVMCAATES